ncbi:MAG: hypothetical protein WBB31_09530 [Saprospiraceae bacterium]
MKKPLPQERLLSFLAFMAVCIARRSASAMTGLNGITGTHYTGTICAGTVSISTDYRDFVLSDLAHFECFCHFFRI